MLYTYTLRPLLESPVRGGLIARSTDCSYVRNCEVFATREGVETFASLKLCVERLLMLCSQRDLTTQCLIGDTGSMGGVHVAPCMEHLKHDV